MLTKPEPIPPLLALCCLLIIGACAEDDPNPCTFDGEPLVVNSLLDGSDSPDGTLTLRAALAEAASCQPIQFDPSLDGGTIELTVVGEAHTILRGEVMGMRDEASGPVSYLVGYHERDYGPSALYARKHVVIDASDLPSGITLAWTGGAENPARVLAVYGDLTLTNVTVTGGHSVAEALPGDDAEAQPWTLARGGGVAVWGRARLEDCTLADNHCVGDFDSSRDRGAFGGGLYADIVEMERCVVSGNTVIGAGAAGGGVYSVGGAGSRLEVSTITDSAITGNRIGGLFAYGGGVYSDGGGIGNLKRLVLTGSTIARNVVEPAPGLPPFLLGMGYWRGGGVYMSNGDLHAQSVTVVENEVSGYPRTDALGKPNLAGGIAATIGNAHAVERMIIGHAIVAGNSVTELGPGGASVRSYPHDIFTGSLLHFESRGYNRFGALDFSQMLVPVGEWRWESLSRRHYPKIGDLDGLELADLVDLADGVATSDRWLSAGSDASETAVLHYQPQGSAVNQIPTDPYSIENIYAEYSLRPGATDDFLAIVLQRLEAHYAIDGFASAFVASFEEYLRSVDTDEEAAGVQPHADQSGDAILDLSDTRFQGPGQTWPKEVWNYAYIEFWHRLDRALLDHDIPGMGPEVLGDGVWGTLFRTGSLAENGGIRIDVDVKTSGYELSNTDQLGVSRPAGDRGDIGAIEAP